MKLRVNLLNLSSTGSDNQRQQISSFIIIQTNLHRFFFIVVENYTIKRFSNEFYVGILLIYQDWLKLLSISQKLYFFICYLYLYL